MTLARAILDFMDVPTAPSWAIPPEDALAFMRAKGLRTTFDFRDMNGNEHARAFTIAKMMDADLLATMRESLDDALANGVPFATWRDSIIPTLQAKGWWGRQRVTDPLTGNTIVAELGSPSRLQTIYRTNIQSAYAAGAWQAIEDQAEDAPYLLYDAVDDHRTRPEHAAWDGTVLPVNHPWWKTHYPPNGWNCRCSVIQLSAEEAAELGVDIATKPPKDGTYTWENPRTDKRHRVPKGIDPTWNTNAGEQRAKALRDQVDSKLASYPPDFARAAQRGFQITVDEARKVVGASAGSSAAANIGQAARASTRNANKVAQAALDAAYDAGGPLKRAIDAILRTKDGRAMSAAELLEAAEARVAAERLRRAGEIDGF